MSETQEDPRRFDELAERVGEDALIEVVGVVDKMHEGQRQTREVARSIIWLRDEGDERGRQLAIETVREYFDRWVKDWDSDDAEDKLTDLVEKSRRQPR